MRKKYEFFCLIILIILGCNSSDKKKLLKSNSTEIIQNVDISIDSLSKMSLPEMELDNFRRIKDTIVFTSPSSFLYFPLGEFKQEQEMLKDYPQLKLSHQKYSTDIDIFELSNYRYGRTFIKMVENNESGLLDVVFAKIVDNGIILKNGVAIGSLKSNFTKKFFKPLVDLKKYNVIKIESLILGITHLYTFKDDKLAEIIIDSDYQIDKN